LSPRVQRGIHLRTTNHRVHLRHRAPAHPGHQGTRHPGRLRREQPHPGAQLRFTDIDGHRYQVFITDLPEADPAYLDALYRGRGRMECRIRDAKDTGLTNLPSRESGTR